MIVATRMPVSTTGQASGSLIRSSRFSGLMPMPRAASSTAPGTPSSPVMVLRRIGNTAYSTSAVIVGARPSPNSGMSRPNSASDGTVSMVPATPSARARARGRPSTAIPSPIPTTAATATAISTTSACSAASRAIVGQRSER